MVADPPALAPDRRPSPLRMAGTNRSFQRNPRRKPKGGRPRVPGWATLTGLIFVLKEMECDSGITC